MFALSLSSLPFFDASGAMAVEVGGGESQGFCPLVLGPKGVLLRPLAVVADPFTSQGFVGRP